MADNVEIDANTVRGNDWEVVSLTASAYAAAPGPKVVEQGVDDKSVSTEAEGETTQALFMSRHFDFPLDENLNSKADKSLMQKTDKDEDLMEEGYKTHRQVEDNQNIKVSKQSLTGPELEASEIIFGMNATEKEDSVYGAAAYGSLHDAPVDKKVDTPDLIKSSERESDVDPDIPEIVVNKKESSDESNVNREAWWKRHAASFYAHAKETNTFWSIFVAAAVMGLAVLGHHWQKGKRQTLQLKLEVVVKDEKAGRVLQPMSRLKDVIVGGSRANNSFTRGASYEL